MTSLDRLQLRTLIIGIALIPPTALSIYLVYGPDLFSKWSWVRFSVAMAILTCLWTYTFWYPPKRDDKQPEQSKVIIFGLICVPLDALLTYPGLEALGLHMDSKMGTLLVALVIMHGLGFYLIQREIERYRRNFPDGR